MCMTYRGSSVYPRVVLFGFIKRLSPFFPLVLPLSASIRATTCHAATQNTSANGYHYHYKPTFLLYISFGLHRHKHKLYQFCTQFKRSSLSKIAEVQPSTPHDGRARNTHQPAKQTCLHAFRQNDDQYKTQPSLAQAANPSSGGDTQHQLSHLVKTGYIGVEGLALIWWWILSSTADPFTQPAEMKLRSLELRLFTCKYGYSYCMEAITLCTICLG